MPVVRPPRPRPRRPARRPEVETRLELAAEQGLHRRRSPRTPRAMLHPLDERRQVVALGILQVGVVDQRATDRVIAAQVRRPRERGVSSAAKRREPAAHRHLGEQVRVDDAVHRARGRHLRERLLVGHRTSRWPRTRSSAVPAPRSARGTARRRDGRGGCCPRRAGRATMSTPIPASSSAGPMPAAEQQRRRAVRPPASTTRSARISTSRRALATGRPDRATALHQDTVHSVSRHAPADAASPRTGSR